MPPHGKVRIAAPLHLSEETIRLYAISKLTWIKKQQKRIRSQARESRRQFINKETHYFQGRKYLLRIIEEDNPPRVVLRKSYIDLYVRPKTNTEKRRVILNEWYRAELKRQVPVIITKWEKAMAVNVRDFGIRLMKTKWGTCNIEARRLWLNLELAKKPPGCLEYIVVHEMVHLIERHHNDRFLACMKKFLPQWKDRVEELNRLPVSYSEWEY
ncbi:MAG: SprT family zinc-dependent metalloprotease [Cyclobacteriaceae bacterium]